MQGTCQYLRTYQASTFHAAESPHAGYVSVPQDIPSVHIPCSRKSTCRVRVSTSGHTKRPHSMQPKVHMQGTCQYLRTLSVHIPCSRKSTCRVRVSTSGHEASTFHVAESPHAGYVSVPQDIPSVHIPCSRKSTCRVRVSTSGHTKRPHSM